MFSRVRLYREVILYLVIAHYTTSLPQKKENKFWINRTRDINIYV